MNGLSPYNIISTKKSQSSPLWNKGFTIVELLIVVVVIAILATITIVAYNSVTRSAEEASIKTDLSQASKKLELYKINNEDYPAGNAITAFAVIGYTTTDGTDYNYSLSGSGYCLDVTKNNQTFHITNTTGTPQEGECTNGPIANGDPMQSMTSNQCSALTTFTGSNEEAVMTLTDSRGGTERTYRVAKLADGNCWMLDNLKLGSTSGAITITPSDSDVVSNFDLPPIQGAGAATDFNNPYVYGPVTGDSGEGATNYGYLYNWTAATAGAGLADNAPYSICPARWRLPTVSPDDEFAMLNARMNHPSASVPSASGGNGFYQNWQHSGPFKGVFSGRYSGTNFNSQGSYGRLWSSSPNTSIATYAFYASFSTSGASMGNSAGTRSNGFGVRCLLN